MKAVFADTFYWVALTAPTDAAYERANLVTDDIVTTDEVLTRISDLLLHGFAVYAP